MARAPAPSALSAPPPGPAAGGMGGDAGGMMGADPSAGADPAAGGDMDGGGALEVICTICKSGDGSYVIFAGDEPDSGGGGGGDMSEDDANAMGPAGAVPAPPGGGGGGAEGQPEDSVGATMKAVLDILNADKSSEGAPGNADDQLAAGFSADKNPTPASGPSQKY